MTNRNRHLSFVVCAALAALTVPARAEPAPSPPPESTAGAPATQDAPALHGAAKSTIGSPAAQVPPVLEGTVKRRASTTRYALGVNQPVGWLVGHYGASAYLGLGRHHAVRSNIARYSPNQSAYTKALIGERGRNAGTILDLGVSWVWYPRSLWDGFTLEAGVLQRLRDVTAEERDSDPEIRTESSTYAVRTMVGWSWLIGRRVFIAVAAGVSLGVELGREELRPIPGMPTTREVSRRQVGAETYLRVGIALGR